MPPRKKTAIDGFNRSRQADSDYQMLAAPADATSTSEPPPLRPSDPLIP